MVRSLLVVLCLSTGPIATAAALVVAEHPSPGTPVPEVVEGQEIAYDVPFRNPYDFAIRIIDTDSTCTCNRLELAETFLLPGQATILHFATGSERHSGNKDQRVWLFASDPDTEAMEIVLRWRVRPHVAVDVLPPNSDPRQRPADHAYRDIYQLIAHERPDEPHRLDERLLLSCPPEGTPPGGLQVAGVDYAGAIWEFVAMPIDERHVLVRGRARTGLERLPEGLHAETFTIRTNHPDKPAIEIAIEAAFDFEAGRAVKALGEQPLIP